MRPLVKHIAQPIEAPYLDKDTTYKMFLKCEETGNISNEITSTYDTTAKKVKFTIPATLCDEVDSSSQLKFSQGDKLTCVIYIGDNTKAYWKEQLFIIRDLDIPLAQQSNS